MKSNFVNRHKNQLALVDALVNLTLIVKTFAI